MFLDPNIERVLKDALHREGWNDGKAVARKHAADKGGWTRGGITAGAWGRYTHLGRPATPQELNAISESEALEFYFNEYVTVPALDRVPDQKLRALLIDWCFTSWDDPIRAMQTSLKRRGHYDGAIDGTFGPKTKAALLVDRDPRMTYRDVLAARVRHYFACAYGPDVREFLSTHPDSQLINLKGWVYRCLEFIPS